MTAYLLRRLLLMLPVAFLVTVGVFLLIHLSPGDPALIILGEDRSPQAIAQIHQELGLDKPLYVQYVIWLDHIAHGDWGRSITTHQPVAIAITERLPATFELGITALVWSLLVAIPLGTIAAVRRGSVADQLASGVTVAGVSIPNFFIGIVLIFVLSVSLRLFPFGGYVPFFQDPLESLHHVALPAIALGTAGAAINMRFTRSSMIEVLDSRYAREFATHGDLFLEPYENVRTALSRFEEKEVEFLPVVDSPGGKAIIGYLTEQYALRRYNQELERRRNADLGERDLFSIAEPPR